MKTGIKILASIAALISAGLLVHFTRKYNNCNRLTQISDEGYETANDILYPRKNNRGKLHYGPVLPEHTYENQIR